MLISLNISGRKKDNMIPADKMISPILLYKKPKTEIISLIFFSSFSNIYEANLSGIPRTYAHKRVRKKRKRKIKTQTKHEQTNIITKYTES